MCKEIDFEAIKNELREMYELDQKMRSGLKENKENWDSSIDKENTERLKEIIRQTGVLTISKVGKNGSMYAWLLVQHADNDIDFQERYLNLMKLESKDEIHQDNIAYLEDRVAVAKGEEQVYGTQFFIDQDGVLKPRPIIDIKNLEKRRKSMGLESFEEYEKLMLSNI